MAYVDDSGGTFIGNIGFGGVTPGFVMHVEHDKENDKLAFFKNTATNGYGVRINNGVDSNYGLKVSSAAGDDFFLVFGKRVVNMGGATMLSAMQGNAQVILNIEGSAADGADAGIAMTSTTGVATHMLYASGDRGWRFLYNYRPPVAGNSYSDSDLAQLRIDFEQDGVISMNYGRPHNTTPSTYDYPNVSGKVFLFRVGGVLGAGGIANEYAQFGIGQPTRGLQIGVADTDANWPITKIQIDPSAATNPIWIWVNGSLHNVVVDGSGFLKVA